MLEIDHYLKPKDLDIGSSDKASDVLHKIVLKHGIEALGLVFYDDDYGGYLTEDRLSANDTFWVPEVSIPDLKAISDANYSDIENCRLMAISSRVLLHNGWTAHIPMMDFDAGELRKMFNKVDLREEVDEISSVLGSTPGVILNSGAGYHFWGINLVSEQNWRASMEARLAAEKRRIELNRWPIYDKRFIEFSLKRGHSALRIFGYEHSDKDSEPRVVALLG